MKPDASVTHCCHKYFRDWICLFAGATHGSSAFQYADAEEAGKKFQAIRLRWCWRESMASRGLSMLSMLSLSRMAES